MRKLISMAVLTAVLGGVVGSAWAALPRLTPKGKDLVDPSGKVVTLKGVNLGNWLVIETWMLRLEKMPDQYTIMKTLRERFGDAEAEKIIGLYRDNYITQRDLDGVRDFGFNVVRLPFAWDLFQSDTAPFTMKPDEEAFKYLDRCLEMAEKAGVYVILDLHGAPGSQSKEHHTYQEKRNEFFHKEENLKRAEDIWRRVAKRYAGRASVVAYDLVNEPYGDYKEDLRPDLVKLCDRLYKVIREEDPETVIFFPGTLQGSIEHYGDPKAKGQKNVGFTEHFYPGLFGSAPRPRTHYSLMNGKIKQRAEMMDRLGTPYLVGEFNVVLEKSGGDAMMRRWYDLYGKNGWMATAWSWKLLKPEGGAKPDNWYFATNAQDIPKLDVRTDSKEAIEAWCRNLGAMELAYDETLRSALKASVPPEIVEPPAPPLPAKVPTDQPPAGWSVMAVGSPSPRGGFRAAGEASAMTALVSGGGDVWGEKDSVVVLGQKLAGDGEVSVTIGDLMESGQYAKGGLMLRASEAPDAAMVFVHVFPDGGVAFSQRSGPGAVVVENKLPGTGAFPVKLKLVREGNEVKGYFARRNGEFREVGKGMLAGPALAGLAVTSHDAGLLTAAEFGELKVVGK